LSVFNAHKAYPLSEPYACRSANWLDRLWSPYWLQSGRNRKWSPPPPPTYAYTFWLRGTHFGMKPAMWGGKFYEGGPPTCSLPPTRLWTPGCLLLRQVYALLATALLVILDNWLYICYCERVCICKHSYHFKTLFNVSSYFRRLHSANRHRR